MPDYPPQLQQALEELNSREQLPRHVAIIMDGNGRWARREEVSLSAGHRAGTKRARNIADFCSEIKNLNILTLYTFSTENWSRSDEEITTLFELLVEFLDREVERMVEDNVRLQTIGDISAFPSFVRQALAEAKEKTSENTEFILNLALNYGARDEIIRAVKNIGQKIEAGELFPDSIDSDLFSKHLDTGDLPDPDFLIRTSGELRLSNFLLWQTAYSEFYFTDCLWPDFGEEEFVEALTDYTCRERRFGRRPTGEQ